MIEAPLARLCLNWVAIDIARYSNAVLIETASGQKHRFRMSNSAVDMQRLVDFLGSLGGQCRVAMEPTGDYHRSIAHRLNCATTPMQIKRKSKNMQRISQKIDLLIARNRGLQINVEILQTMPLEPENNERLKYLENCRSSFRCLLRSVDLQLY